MVTIIKHLTYSLALCFSTAAVANGGIGQPLWHSHVPPVHIETSHIVGWGDRVQHLSHQRTIEHGPHHIDHSPEWHHHRVHLRPLCSCIGNIHVPLDRLEVYQPQD